MIDLLVAGWGFSDVHADLLCSVAMHLTLSQVVNEPNVSHRQRELCQNACFRAKNFSRLLFQIQ